MPKKQAKQSSVTSKPGNRAATRKAARTVPSRPVGRPAMFQTPQEMQKAIDAYFETCKPSFLRIEGRIVLDKNENPIYEENPPTVAGLALFLGFADRSSLYEYAQKPEFTYTVKRAVSRMEAHAEKNLFTKSKPTGDIFWLKNHGWKAEEESKQDVTASVRFVVDDGENSNE